jgi:GNAT superfamily N-acetyltransferase
VVAPVVSADVALCLNRIPHTDPAAVMRLNVRPLTEDRWPDVEAVFEAKGCSMARGCWCMYYRERGTPQIPTGMKPGAYRRQQLHALAAHDPPPGLIGYAGRTPMGWISLGPRDDFPRLARSPVMRPVDAAPVWSIVCFVVPSAHRGQGVAAALLDGAIADAKRRGVELLEAYPVDRSARSAASASMWFGAKSMYDRAGFAEVARRRPERPVVRLALPAGRPKRT